MTTALDLITGALRKINAYMPGESLSADDANDALATLNDLMDSWSNEHLTVYNNNELVFNFTPGKYSYTIGATGADFTAARPLRITNAYARVTASGNSGIDYPIEPISGDVYTSIGLKAQPGPWPKVVYYNMDYPNGSLFFWPNPQSAAELHLWVDDIFSTFSTLTQTVNLPQGYARAIKYNLAIELAPEYGKQVPPEVAKIASDSKAALKSLNSNPQTIATYDVAIAGPKKDAGWILHGGFR